jgi:hypothetical protein
VTQTVAAIAGLALAACSTQPKPDAKELAAEIDALVASYQPQLDVLVARVEHTKPGLAGHLGASGWDRAWRIAEAANDVLGMPPYLATTPAGPERLIPPGSPLGIGPDLKKRVPKLVEANNTEALARILLDVRMRFFGDIVQVSNYLDQVEYWEAHPGAAVPWHL